MIQVIVTIQITLFLVLQLRYLAAIFTEQNLPTFVTTSISFFFNAIENFILSFTMSPPELSKWTQEMLEYSEGLNRLFLLQILTSQR